MTFATQVLLLFTLTYSTTCGAEIIAQKSTGDQPLELTVLVTGTGSSWEDVEVECRVRNNSDEVIPFNFGAGTRGVSMELRDRDGKLVRFTPDGSKRFQFIDEKKVPNLRRAELPPKRSVVVRENLLNLFEAKILSGYSLRIRWVSGYPRNLDLVTDVSLPELK